MKKVIFIFTAVLFFISSCKKEEQPEIISVSSEHKCLFLDFTATWCCPCGSYSKYIEDALSKYPYKAICMELHASNDPYYDQNMYWSWANIYGVTGIPSYVGNNREVIWGWMAPDYHLDTTDFCKVVKEAVNVNPPDCGIGISKSISGSSMTIKTKTVFFRETSGKFNLCVYVVEDGLHYTQSCNSDDTHNNVFRASLTDTQGKGVQLLNGAATKGKTFDNSFAYSIPSGYVTDNLHIIVVVYEMDSSNKPVRILNVNRI